jgi:DNA-binding LytR/AlgR family response regulator
MNCIIGADSVTCKLLEEFVGKSSSLNLVGTFIDSGSLSNQLSKQHNVDLLFLDIEILEMDGYDFISSLDYKPNIIVISSSAEFALKAFDISVVDYLLKPVTYSRFYKSIDKAIRFYSRREVSNNADNEIFIKKDSSLIKVKLKDILYIEALENYITITTLDKKFTIHFTMKAIENQLPSGIFFRVHRSFIVNKSMIKAIKEDSLDLIVGKTLKSFPVSKSYRDLLLNNLNMMAKKNLPS